MAKANTSQDFAFVEKLRRSIELAENITGALADVIKIHVTQRAKLRKRELSYLAKSLSHFSDGLHLIQHVMEESKPFNSLRRAVRDQPPSTEELNRMMRADWVPSSSAPTAARSRTRTASRA